MPSPQVRLKESLKQAVRESNKCRVPKGSPKGGQFCARLGLSKRKGYAKYLDRLSTLDLDKAVGKLKTAIINRYDPVRTGQYKQYDGPTY